mmetsp:Transcript_70219/g.124995  ORF Transcript_70219/g.124995 Transcript_70219/m.124995 type:complete len:262 (+) Transcript_70219:3-788(+)
MVGSNPSLLELLDECVKQMQAAYGNMLVAEFAAMRQSLCTFFQDRKVKVSLFLHDHTQNHDGSIVVPSSGTLAAGALPTGTVRYFSGGVEAQRDQLPTVSSAAWAINCGTRTVLGANLYEKDRPAGADGGAAPVASPEAAAVAGMPAAPVAPLQPPEMAPAVGDSYKATAAVGELKLLASLIGAGPPPEAEAFKLENLFGANVFSKDPRTRGAEIIEIDGTAPSEHQRGLESIRRQMEALDMGSAEAAAAPDDLLDLMDRA